MIRKLLFYIFISFITTLTYAQSGSIKGKLLDTETGEAIPFANVVVEQNGNQIAGGVSDFDGNYTIKPIPAGRFTIRASYIGYKTMQINDVVVYNDKIRFLNIQLESTSQNIDEIVVVEYTVPLIDKDNTSTGGTVTSEDIAKMAGRTAESVASTVGGVYQEDGQVKSIRGSREDATVYFIDGVKVTGSKAIPKSAISEVSVITGGTPAKYGDVTGGVINIVTKGASRDFFGSLELATSKFLDPYNSNLIAGNLSGPILTKKVPSESNPDVIHKEPLIGFFVAGEYQYIQDPNPSATGFWKAKDHILDSMARTPIVLYGAQQVGVPSASFLQAEDFENVKTRQNVAQHNLMLQGKLDFQLRKNITLTLGGNYASNNQSRMDFTRNTDNKYYNDTKGKLSGSVATGLFNAQNHSQLKQTTYRAYARFTHRMGNAMNPDNSSIFKNAYYTIQADYSKYKQGSFDQKHKDNLFDYGYIGRFETFSKPTYEYGEDTITGYEGYIMNAFQDTLISFVPGTVNPELTRYTEMWYDFYGNPMNKTQIRENGGLVNGEMPSDIYSMVSPIGVPASLFYNTDNDQFRVTASGATDIRNHEISLGFEFEKKTDRYYEIEPQTLWELARQNMNNHIQELDFSNPQIAYLKDNNGNYVLDASGNKVFNDTINYNRLYNKNTQSLFDIKMRESQGIAINSTDFIDVDSFDPDNLDISYFSPDELYNNADELVSYYGYDAYGNKLNSTPSFEDFFTQTIAYGGKDFYTRNVAPFQPIYMAGYIQDKFAFNDLIFNIGVRIDRYDANQKVQTDPYLIYTAHKAGDADELGLISDVPANISSDAVVYVNSTDEPTEINGYRDENRWYDAQGNQISDPQELYSNGSIQPYLTNPNDRVGDESFLKSFSNYDPDIAIMPRISFSFPISDEALFFAHYDILTKRPSDYRSRLNPIDYLFIYQNGSKFFTNPNLKLEKTIDYEFGFQQKLTNKSSLKLSAFYREQRDMVQATLNVGAYPIDMRTYSNIDFGTVKGFSTTYDLRRTRNIQFKASYTLTFANATGSDPTTSINLISSGQPNLRTTLPTNFDQRHTFAVIMDYRFASGKAYNGPRWFGTDLFANAGLNMMLNAGSGTPYTKRYVANDKVEGSINGSYMPWRSTIGIKIDKSFMVRLGRGDDAKVSDLNIYLDIVNLLNSLNTSGVYSTTGNPDDDAKLASGRTAINSSYDQDAYYNYYMMMLSNPAHYSRPRQIRVGMLWSF